MGWRATDIATNSSPVSAAAAVATAVNSSRYVPNTMPLTTRASVTHTRRLSTQGWPHRPR